MAVHAARHRRAQSCPPRPSIPSSRCWNMSIRLRLTFWYTALLILVLAGFALLVYVVVGQQLASRLDYDMRLRALQASRTLRAVSGGYSYRSVTPLDLPAALPQMGEGP